METQLHKTRRPRALKLCFITKNAEEEQGEEVLLFVCFEQLIKRVCVFKTITYNTNNNTDGIFINREECWVSFFEGIDAKADAKANESKTKQKDEHLFGGCERK
jgi:hypothetical protein